jgi:hypothetical protein
MKRFAVGRNGIVVNVIAAEAISDVLSETGDVFEDVAGTINVGDAYDVKDVHFDRLDALIFKLLFQTINDVRVLKGQAILTAAQFKTFVKNQMT